MSESQRKRAAFPSMANHPRWPGAWKWGVDFSDGSTRVLVVGTGAPDQKYDTMWLGPIEITEETARQLEAWAQAHIGVHGGYFHLFPADGDARQELQEFWDEREEEGDS